MQNDNCRYVPNSLRWPVCLLLFSTVRRQEEFSGAGHILLQITYQRDTIESHNQLGIVGQVLQFSLFIYTFIFVAAKLNVKLFKGFHVSVFLHVRRRDTMLLIGRYSCRSSRICNAYADCRLLRFMYFRWSRYLCFKAH